MQTSILNQSLAGSPLKKSGYPIVSRFITWCRNQEEDRLLWTAIGITFHGCVLAPLTMLAVLLAGGAMPLIMLVVVAMGIPLVANLAALPTRITIPAFILSLAIDAGVLVACVVLGPGQVNIF